MTPNSIDPKALEAADTAFEQAAREWRFEQIGAEFVVNYVADRVEDFIAAEESRVFHRFASRTQALLFRRNKCLSVAIRAYMSALSISDGEGAVAPEPYKWEGYWSGAGSIDSITRHTAHKPTAEKWKADGAEVTPLFTHPAPVAAQPAEGMVDAIVNGSAPMSRWVGSVDYSTYDGFEQYLETQLRQKLDLKVSLDKKRHETAEDESLATFVDGGMGAFEEALATYRTVRERVATRSRSCDHYR